METARWSTGCLVVHGDADATGPVEPGRGRYGALAGEQAVCILPGADHRFIREEDQEVALNRVEDWMVLHSRSPEA